MTRANYKRIGDYIRQVKNKNKEGKYSELLGINIDKFFMPSVANTVGVNLKNYKIIEKGQFACNRMHVGRDYRIPIALSDKEIPFLVSPAYDVFEIVKKDVLLPEYLMMWFRRKEFDRNAWFHTDADVRGGLAWDAFCDLKLPIPSIEKQREIVKEYNTVTNRIKLNEQLNQKLEETAQALYKHWFVDFEFPCLPSDYRPHGQVNLKISDEELRSKIAQVSTYRRVGGLPVPDGKSWFVYIIECVDGTFYKGMTNDLYRRFYEHFTGIGAEWTKTHKPLRIIHWEAFDNQDKTAKREKELKTGYGRTWLKRQYNKLKTGSPAPKMALRTAGEMIYNAELDKEIPKGWEVGVVGELLDTINGYAFKSNDFTNTGAYPIIKIKNVVPPFVQLSDCQFFEGNLTRKLERVLVKKNDILISMTGSGANQMASAVGQVGKYYNSKASLLNQRVCKLEPKKETLREYIYQFISNEETHLELLNGATGSANQANISPDQIKGLVVIMPENKVMEKFQQIGKTLDESKRFNSNIKLLKLKEFILSKMTKVEQEKEVVI
ncbi:restriction endonuclease subunit S [Flavobacteriaceae bacterium F08102]|nr:restriction endonuclease subunit S [Flavobacteriaceae bacterium F08102]